MRKIFVVREDDEINKVLNETYEDILAALKHRNPRAESLVEDGELFQLHDLLALLRLGHIKLGDVEDVGGRYIALEVKEEGFTF
jgi:hypothetical protein